MSDKVVPFPGVRAEGEVSLLHAALTSPTILDGIDFSDVADVRIQLRADGPSYVDVQFHKADAVLAICGHAPAVEFLRRLLTHLGNYDVDVTV